MKAKPRKKARREKPTETFIEPTARDECEAKPKSEPLPDLPMEDVTQFIGRMKKDYDLTNI